MQITNKNWLINGAEKTYQQFRPQIGLEFAQKTNPLQKAMRSLQAAGTPITKPADILSVRETETLQALFNTSAERNAFYGPSRTRQSQAGFLLDVKG